jgi:CHAT domain-containing protein
MEQAELAARLAAAGEAERAALFDQHAALWGVELAYALKDITYTVWASDPAQAVGADGAVAGLAQRAPAPEIHALADWTGGIAALTQGQMEDALERLDRAAAGFEGLGQPHPAAATQVSKLIALAMLGRYDEAVTCGQRARAVFLAQGDELAAGKIEQNLGNLHFRRDRYAEAERWYRAARARFEAVRDAQQLAQIDVCLAVALASQHRFHEAAQLYEAALPQTEAAGLEVTRAEIECNLGCLALFQGQFDRALDYLERSRRRYVALGLPHESAIAELELADAYLELNLAPEAAAIYARVIPTFAELGLRAEQARALAHSGRAFLLLEQPEQARGALAEARDLYVAEENAVGAAAVTLAEAQLYRAEGDYAQARRAAAEAEVPLAAAGAWGRWLEARWLQGEAARGLGQTAEAHAALKAARREAEQRATPQITQRCDTSLGLLAAAQGDTAEAQAAFTRAIGLIEELRAPLPAEEFRTAFLADKLTAYAELVRLCLADGRPARVAEALGYVERARSRALLDMLGGAFAARLDPEDPFEAELWTRLEGLREELSWFYSQINRGPDLPATRGAEAMAALYDAAREREATVQTITLQLQQRAPGPFARVEPLDLAGLQRDLGPDAALVEYFSLDGQLLAFVVTGQRVEVIRQLGSEAEAEAALRQLHFQMEALRYSPSLLRPHLPQLAARTRQYLAALYDQLLRPLEAMLGARRLVVVPYRALHYVPFQALHDGQAYVIERRAVSYAPSASVLRHCLARPSRRQQRAVLLGVPDAHAPHVRGEVTAIAPHFAEAVTLLADQATLAALQGAAPGADVLHLACHGQFRPDNPLFSALRLSDRWLTVREASRLDLRHCGLVVLSACETGLSALAPGDDLIGLARGFFSAGAPSLVVSLWTVDDETTAQLMSHFYARLRAGDGPAAALQSAQRRLLAQNPHPFFWSPFVLLGRW